MSMRKLHAVPAPRQQRAGRSATSSVEITDEQRAKLNPWALAVADARRDLGAAALLYRLRWRMQGAKLRPRTRRHRDDERLWSANTREWWAAECGLTVRQVDRALSKLSRLGLITRERHRFGAKTILWLTTDGCKRSRPELRAAATPGVTRDGKSLSGDLPNSATPRSRAKRQLQDLPETVTANSRESLCRESLFRESHAQGAAALACGAPPRARSDVQGEVGGEEEREPHDAAGPRPSYADVMAMTERARSTIGDLMRVWHAGLCARDTGYHPELRPRGKEAGQLKTIRDSMPRGTVVVVVALLALRWDSFRDYLMFERGWDGEKISGQPSLGLAASQLEAVAAWMQLAPDTKHYLSPWADLAERYDRSPWAAIANAQVSASACAD